MIKEILATETLPLRSTVLRSNIPYGECVFQTDASGFHLGAFAGTELVSVATFFPEDYPELGSGGYRLRGMATHFAYQGQGHGAALIKAAIHRLKLNGTCYLWCNARTSAVGFYKKLGFVIISEEFEVPGIGPHYNMSIQINKI
jgi:ribosomal protein S18 acetylase RimI-like enzyme